MRATFLAAAVIAAAAVATPVAADHGMSHEVTVSAIDNEQHLPSVAYNWQRDEYLVVWHNQFFNGRDVYGRRVDRFGRVLNEFVISSDLDDRAQPAVAYDWVNDRYLVVYIVDVFGDGSDYDVYGRLIGWDGPNPGWTEFPICTWTSSQWNPQVEYAGSQQEFMVVWTNTPAGVPAYVSARRVSPDGSTPHGGFTVSSGAEPRVNPQIAYNLARNEHLVTYDLVAGGGSGVDIWATRMTAGGTILGGGEFAVAAWPGTEEHPDVAACRLADKYLVVWQSLAGADNYDVYGRFVNGDGTIDGAPVLFDATSIDEREPTVGCMRDDTRFLVAWQQEYSSVGGPVGVQAQSIGSDHAKDASFAPRVIYVGETIHCTDPVIAGGDGGWFIAWEQDRQGTAHQDIHGRSVWELLGSGFEGSGFHGWSSHVP